MKAKYLFKRERVSEIFSKADDQPVRGDDVVFREFLVFSAHEVAFVFFNKQGCTPPNATGFAKAADLFSVFLGARAARRVLA